MRGKSCFGILFSLSIIVGVILGRLLFNHDGGTITPTPTPTPTPITPEIDDTVLFLGVNTFEADRPLLEGAWTATLCNKNDHPANTIHIILIAFYPFIPEHVTSPGLAYLAKPHEAIPINPNDLSNLREIPPLSLTSETWDHVIIVDEVAMNLIIWMTNSNLPDDPPPISENTFVKTWKNPTRAYNQHKAILTTLCEEPKNYTKLPTINEIIKLNGTHLKTNLTDTDLIKMWQSFNYTLDKEIKCEFFP